MVLFYILRYVKISKFFIFLGFIYNVFLRKKIVEILGNYFLTIGGGSSINKPVHICSIKCPYYTY